MALLLTIEEDGDDVIVRKIPRNGREEQEPALRLANVPGHYVTGMRLEMNEGAKMLSVHVLLAAKLLVSPGGA